MKREMVFNLELRLSQLEEETQQVRKLLNHWKDFPEEELTPVVTFIENHPGCTKQDIREHLMISDKGLDLLLTKARRNWGLIKNCGSRKYPKWYKVLSVTPSI